MNIEKIKSADWIVINSSAGKDSQAMLDHVVRLAQAEDIPLSKLVVVHADLGKMEWAGTPELAQAQATAYGLRFIKVSRVTARGQRQSLLEQVEARGMWPSSTTRYCTSDHKRDPIAKVFTQLQREAGRHVTIINCMGIRSDESPARGKKNPWEHDKRASNGNREVWRWFPIFDWKVARVWETIRASGVTHHPAYDLGMPRLSCVFCIFAPKSALVLAGKHNPELLREYVRVEQKINHTFRKDLSLASVLAEVEAGAQAGPVSDWKM